MSLDTIVREGDVSMAMAAEYRDFKPGRDLEQQEQYERLSNMTEVGPEAFANLPTAIVCMDERARIDGRAFIGLAGSGVLLDDEQRKSFLAKIDAAGIDTRSLEVTQHESCGACGLYCQDHEGCKPEEAAAESANRLANLAETTKPVAKIGWSTEANYQAVGDEGAHHARVIYVDFTGRFNPAAVDLPDGFLISAAYTPEDEKADTMAGRFRYLQNEVKIAKDIAMGHHGRGEDYFRKNGPLLLVVIADDQQAATEALGDARGYKADPENTVTRTIFLKPQMKSVA